jgi:hypothetical protein
MNSPLMCDGTFDSLLELADHVRREAGKCGRQISTPENRGLGWHKAEESAVPVSSPVATIMPGSNPDYKYKCEFLIEFALDDEKPVPPLPAKARLISL